MSAPLFKAKTRKGQFRKRALPSSSSNSEDSGSDERTEAIDLRLKKPNRGLQQSTTSRSKASQPCQSSSSDDEFANNGAKPVEFSYKSTRSGKSEGPNDMGATAHIELDTKQDRDAQAIIEKAKKANESEEAGGSKFPFYSGQYTNPDMARKQRYGPQRAPLNIRSTTRWDYAPDICKDYKETGQCGFGDSCKFLHDRSDFKFGWQLEGEYDAGTYDNDDINKYEIEDEQEQVPTTEDYPDQCWVCRGSYKDPVQISCEHFFCEECFLKSVAPKKKCPVCARPTDGNAKVAKKFRELLQQIT